MKLLADSKKTLELIEQMSLQIGQTSDAELCFVGIRTRGVPLAARLASLLEKNQKKKVLLGSLDITLYRDDLSRISEHPVVRQTDITFSLDGKVIYLVDDVLFTGRTIRAALDALFDLGRPQAVRLITLVDRGGRELPIQADVVGLYFEARPENVIHVKLTETDQEEGIWLEGRGITHAIVQKRPVGN